MPWPSLRKTGAKYCLQRYVYLPGSYAPDALVELPIPAHVFIGGSGGEIGSILVLSSRVIERKSGGELYYFGDSGSSARSAGPPADPVISSVCRSGKQGEVLGTIPLSSCGNPVGIISFQGAGKTQG